MQTLVRSLALLTVFAAGAGAQLPVPPVPPTTVPVTPAPTAPELAPPFDRPNGALLRPGTSLYQLSIARNGVTTPLGTRTVAVSESSAGVSPGWLIAESRSGSAVETTDSLWVARADLSPERWTATIGKAQLGASFSRDSMFGAVQTYQGRSSFVAPLSAGTLVTPAMIEQVVSMLPLREGYRAGASLVLLEMGSPRALPAEIVVERAEQVALAGGTVDCWLVALRAGAMEERLWVSRSAPRVVKTEQATGSGVLTGVLVN
jgi:hypothetical protein